MVQLLASPLERALHVHLLGALDFDAALRLQRQLIERAAAHSFYREMARFLHGFADEEIVAMGLRIDDLDRGRAVVPKTEIRVEFNPGEPVCNACESVPTASKRGAAVHTLHDLR